MLPYFTPSFVRKRTSVDHCLVSGHLNSESQTFTAALIISEIIIERGCICKHVFSFCSFLQQLQASQTSCGRWCTWQETIFPAIYCSFWEWHSYEHGARATGMLMVKSLLTSTTQCKSQCLPVFICVCQ